MEPPEEHNHSSGVALKQFSYVQNDYSPLNSFIDTMIEQDKAKVKQLHAKSEEYKLRKVIILLLICLLLSLSALIGLSIFKVKSLKFKTVDINEKIFDDTKSDAVKKLTQLKSANAQSNSKAAPINRVVSNSSDVVLDYTLFETTNAPKSFFSTIQSVTTGFKFSNSEDENPSLQHCYATTTERFGNKFVTVALARLENGTLKPANITAKELSQLNLTELEFKELRRYCKFR